MPSIQTHQSSIHLFLAVAYYCHRSLKPCLHHPLRATIVCQASPFMLLPSMLSQLQLPPTLHPPLLFKEQNTPGVVDLTATKDVESHVPSLDENHLANELSKSPIIHALTLISPLPGLEWDLFYNTISTKTNVYHTTPSSFDFSNKFLLDLAKPKQWTSTRVRHMEVLIHMLAARHSTHLLTEKKRSTFVWDERLVDIVLHQGKKWMEDIHTIYTPMLWNCKHWVGLAINLDMGKVAMCELTQFSRLKEFVWRRIPDLYNNSRFCDCGPVSMKFLEMHTLGDPAPHMSGITDQTVDDFRKQKPKSIAFLLGRRSD
ncbi:BnaCnng30650D [Brassica napus]|uniref:BnaCnng30650D protein n=1 Tax=Brassica napus TaxID=3708 RepID=A0A078J2W8_BRANA|nr:BnaCnng30650D [Brassica napus]